MTAPFVVGRRRMLSDRALVAVALCAGAGALLLRRLRLGAGRCGRPRIEVAHVNPPFVVGRRPALSDRALVAVALCAGPGAWAWLARRLQGGRAGVAALEPRLRT